MKKKNFRLLLAAVLTTVMLASAMPAMAQTESVSQNQEDEIMLISADPASSASWTSSKLKAAKVDFTKVASASYDKLRLSWEPLSGVDGYQIYRATSKSGKYAKIATVKGASRKPKSRSTS